MASTRLTGGEAPSAQLSRDLTNLDLLTDADQIAEICAIVSSFIESQDPEQLLGQITEFSTKFSVALPLLKSVSRGLVTVRRFLPIFYTCPTIPHTHTRTFCAVGSRKYQLGGDDGYALCFRRLGRHHAYHLYHRLRIWPPQMD
jgi:hypothetical protein